MISKTTTKPNINGSWHIDDIEKYLYETIYPIRFSFITENNFPIVVSLWFIYESNSIWCAVQDDSTVAKFIKENPKCGFEIGPNKPPYKGVRGQGTARLVPELGGKKLKKLINRYLGNTNPSLTNWLLSRSENEVAICIEPICFYSWDYSARMK